MDNNIKKRLFTLKEMQECFIQGSHFKEKWFKKIKLSNSDIILKEPDFKKYLKSLENNN